MGRRKTLDGNRYRRLLIKGQTGKEGRDEFSKGRDGGALKNGRESLTSVAPKERKKERAPDHIRMVMRRRWIGRDLHRKEDKL